MWKYLKGFLTAFSSWRHGQVCRCKGLNMWQEHLWPHGPSFPGCDLIKGHFGNSSVLRATKNCGGRSRGGKTNIKILVWSWVATGQLGDENGWHKAFHLWGSATAWLQGKKARTSVSWAAPMNESPLSCWGEGRMCLFAQPESHANQGSKEAPGDGKKPSATRPEMPPTMERSAQGLRRKGPLFWQKVPRFYMEPSEAEYWRSQKMPSMVPRNLHGAGRWGLT